MAVQWPFKSSSVLLAALPPLTSGHAFTHVHGGRGRVIQDAARVDAAMRIRSACPHSTFVPMPDLRAAARSLERARVRSIVFNNRDPRRFLCKKQRMLAETRTTPCASKSPPKFWR